MRTKEKALTRFVHAKRARTLRKRGVDVRFSHWGAYGHPLYTWTMQGKR